jgi:hypothetical protein
MTHPAHYIHKMQTVLEEMSELLKSKNDTKAELIRLVKETQKEIQPAFQSIYQKESEDEEKQQSFFDKVIFEFSTDNKFEDTIERKFDSYLLDMKDINNLIGAERRLQNKNDEFLHARIILIDYDGQDEPE